MTVIFFANSTGTYPHIFYNFIYFSFRSFFLDTDSLGKSRAEVATRILLELNPDVRGDFVDESVEQLLNNSPDFFENFTVVYAVSLPERYFHFFYTI